MQQDVGKQDCGTTMGDTAERGQGQEKRKKMKEGKWRRVGAEREEGGKVEGRGVACATSEERGRAAGMKGRAAEKCSWCVSFFLLLERERGVSGRRGLVRVFGVY
jgi:hypothetical protein